MPRWGSIITIVLVLLGLLTGLALLIMNPVSNQINNLAKNAPYIGDKIMEATDFVINNKENLPPQAAEIIDTISSSIQDIAVAGSQMIVSFISGAVSATFTLILIPFFFIFMLKDHEKFAPQIYNLFTGERRTWIKETLADIDTVLRNYVQGQVLISAILAIVHLYWLSIYRATVFIITCYIRIFYEHDSVYWSVDIFSACYCSSPYPGSDFSCVGLCDYPCSATSRKQLNYSEYHG